ncbi:tRNA (adenosine(37)-N6)-threonylcarbamoyltransferase complex ATPase subunit type 1 TsaE [Atopobium fossor]|uniref:tRNA (adenosine(37)-N6)-threonylcarbamoyltransferase complex ATPase subunit type 1 TsaE n=1 Tax=Atopobium fossor TaxID=39487 RepID=UPI00040796D8|nr:tRNA (adenosine(37)-N6)-threonylcarbamoyltransferase complex ATPase subunit type 1 TsaE [Atopobium fossor]
MIQLPAKLDEKTYESASFEQTIALGAQLGRLLQAGDVLVLTGDLGAGKTQLTKGIARGMGVADDVTSPTFTIQMIYQGTDLPLYHFDLYRLSDPEQLGDAGVWDALEGDGPCIIEWGEQFSKELGDERLDVFLTRLDEQARDGQEPARHIRFEPKGERACSIVEQLASTIK